MTRYRTIVADPPWPQPDSGARTHSTNGNWRGKWRGKVARLRLRHPLPDDDAPTRTTTTTVTKAEATDYIMLKRDASGFWTQEKTVQARSAEAAVRQLGKEGTYVAVPARSWKPVTVKAETQTVLRLEAATT